MFTDTHLSDTDRKAIHDLALAARALLITETRDLLEGVYGLKADGTLAPLSRLPNLANDPEGQETYARLGHFLDDEVKGGLERREAVDKLVKEVAFTHLNRLVAFKMMEARKLIRQTVSRGKESNGFKFFLADHPDEEARWKSGIAGADVAYRHFLLWQSAQIARELKVLFDPTNLPSRLFPRSNALDALLKLLNAESLAPAWASPETIGWVYQYFNEREKSEVFDRLYKKKQKIRREDIPAATQLFTPRWIVRFLVENTLGRMWVQMHPDSRLKSELRYLVPLAGDVPPESLKPVKEITLLDPACGTMHFGLVAFDLFAEMYREELEHAGQAGWLATPSVANANEIPAAIIANNLFGIDIDLRAVQLSALTLYLKAKELNRDAIITDSNLACADVLALNGERLNKFLQEMNFTKPAYERLVRALWARLKDINQLGSLLRLEQEIAELIQHERELFEREGRQPDLFGERARFEDDAARSEYWQLLEAQLIQAFDEFARRAAQRGIDETLFAGEATKGLRVLDLMLRRYDCVTANPPYMGKRNMNETLGDFLDEAYPNAKGDLYTAFITRCSEFVRAGGRLGMITQQSFMFLSSYEQLREDLLARFAIETMAHTGPRAFAEIGGEKVNTTVFVMRAEPDAEQRDTATGTYFRLVKAEDKQAAFERAIVYGTNIYRIQQVKFCSIPGSPWTYWVSDGIIELFEERGQLRELAFVRQGLGTADDPHFVRKWWEVGRSAVGWNCSSLDDVQESERHWFPYVKSGHADRWYGMTPTVVYWKNNGAVYWERKSTLTGRPTSNIWMIKDTMHLFFKEGITWSDFSGDRLYGRILTLGSIFSHTCHAVIMKNESQDRLAVLAALNSQFGIYILKLLDPGFHVLAGDVSRFPIFDHVDTRTLHHSVQQAIILSKLAQIESENNPLFTIPVSWSNGIDRLIAREQKLSRLESKIDDEVYRLYGISAEDRAAIEAELQNGSTSNGEDDSASGEESADTEGTETQSASRITEEELAVRWISYAVGIILGRFQPGIAGALGCAVYRREDFAIGSLPAPSEEEFDELVGPADKFAYIDSEGGRHVFSAEVEKKLRALADEDGIVVLDEGHSDDLPRKVESALTLMLGEQGAEQVIAAISGQPLAVGNELRKFFERDFFTKWHIKWYQKRPIYWLLQSPRKLYGLYLFHERITKDTLFVVQRKYLDAKIKLTRQLLAEKRAAAKAESNARERRALNKQADDIEKLLLDLEEFAKNLKAITDRGYDPDIDDGVILNLVPLASVMPSWSKEPQKYWDALERGEYDWAHIAMKYWPQRVKQKCKTDKSLAIAHGVG
jgi:hypothetical protein